MRTYSRAKRAVRGDEPDGRGEGRDGDRARCDAVTLLALERTFYSSLNFLGVMTLTGRGIDGGRPRREGADRVRGDHLRIVHLGRDRARGAAPEARGSRAGATSSTGALRVDDSRSIVVLVRGVGAVHVHGGFGVRGSCIPCSIARRPSACTREITSTSSDVSNPPRRSIPFDARPPARAAYASSLIINNEHSRTEIESRTRRRASWVRETRRVGATGRRISTRSRDCVNAIE